MGEHAWIEPDGRVRIHTPAWLEQRTGGLDPEFTRDLHTWAATRTGTGPRDWPALARAWCTARELATPEPDFLTHTGTRLDADLWILRATSGHRYRIAVIGLNQDPPVVHAEIPHLDPGDWFDADSVDIGCPAGHGWVWRTGRELLVIADGTFATLTTVFGPNLDAPFTTCRDCTAHHLGQRTTPCGCDGTPWIICPICGNRCDIDLPIH